MSDAHISVMPDEVVEFLAPLREDAIICDGTLGAGGHTVRLLEVRPRARIVAIDADRAMIERARNRIGERGSVEYRHGWFDEVLGEGQAFDGIVLDLGVSMVHLRSAARGFSLREDGPLDMRLDQREGVPTAADFLASVDEHELADLIYRYGEERYSRRIARAICAAREHGLHTTTALAEVVWHAVPPPYRRGRIHPATRTFQALRIAVNDELGRIERVVSVAAQSLAPGGRLVIISFHSLEDRLIKHGFRALAQTQSGSTDYRGIPIKREEPGFRVVTRKPVIPTDEEIKANPAARSAKMRVLERVQVIEDE